MRGYETPSSLTIESVQNWWEVPCIAHFCSLFRLYFELLDFDIEELEEALLTDGVEDSGSSLLQDLIVRLLRGCYNTKDEITSSNYQMYLRRLFRIKCEEDPTKNNPFDGDVAFHSLPLRTKVEILRDLCDFRLDNEDVSDALKTLEARSLRVEPLGQDSGGSTYWYFYGTRLYREDYSTTPVVPPVRRRGRRRIEPQPPEPPQLITKWQVVCFTEQDWQVLTNKFKNCKSSSDRNLHRTLSNDFLPELPRLFAEKEKLLRQRMLDQQLRRNGRSSSFHVDDSSAGGSGEGSSSVNGCASGSGVNGIGAGSSAFSFSCNGILGAIKPSRLKNNSNNTNRVTNFISSISSILDKSNISFLKRFNQTYNNYHNNLNNNSNNKKKTTNNKKKKVGGRSSGGSGSASTASSSASTSPTPTATATATCSSSGSSKALRGGYNDNSWSQGNNDDDNNNKINAMDLDDEHSERECSPANDEEELRRRREEQEKADRLLAEAIEREERKARLHLRERRGGAFSSPSNAGSRNSSTVSTDRAPQSIKTSTVSKQTVAAAVSKKNSKASPVKASPVKKKGSGKSKSGKGEKKGGRMTNNSLSVSLSPLVDDEEGEQDPDNVDSGAEKKKKKKKKKKHHVTTEDDEDGQTEELGEEEEGEVGEDEEVVPKKKSKSTKSSSDGSPKKTISTKKKKKHSSSKNTTVSSRSPSPTSHTPAVKKVKKSSKTSPISASKKKSTSKQLSKKIVESENEEENQMEVDDELVEEEEEEEFCEEEEEADYESIVARTLHNNNNNKVKGKGAKEKGKSKEKVKSKEKKRALFSGDDEDDDTIAPAEKKSKPSKEKVKEGGSKKSKKSSGEKAAKSGKGKESGKKSKSSFKSESSTAGLIGASSMNLGSGTSKTKVKSSVLFSQSEEDVQIGMHKVIEAIKNHRDAWPFINPVDEDYAPNYYKIIDHPMDLQTMEDKLDNQEYASLDEFKIDFGRIVDNCRKYNGPINEYTEMVETVEQAFNKLLQRYIVPDESDEEISIEYANAASSERKRPSSHSSKKKDKEASKSSVGGGKEASKEHKKENEPTPKTPSKKSSSSKLSSSANDDGDVNEDEEKLERKKKKQQLMRHHSRDSEVIEGLASAAAETLKDLNTWLETTPRPPEKYGENSSVPTSEKGSKPDASIETGDNTKLNKAAKIPPSSSATSSPSPVMKDKKTKKLLSSSGTVVTPKVGQKRKLEFSSNKKARSTQFIMDEDDEYNIDRDLSPPPPKITKTKEEGTPGKVKGSKKNKVKDAKKDGSDQDGKVKEKGKKDKHHHHHHHHKHHHHHHHSHKRDSSSAEESSGVPSTKTSTNSGTKPKAISGGASGNLKNSTSMSSSSSVSSMSTNSSTMPTKPKAKKPKSTSDDPTAAPTKKPKSSKAKSGLGSTGNLLNTLKNSAAYKRMNQISRATKALSSSEPSGKFKSDSLIGLGVPPAAPGSTSLETAVGASASATRDMDGVAEKKKCLLVSDLPGDKEGAPKLSLGSVLSTDAIKLVNLKEIEDELSDDDDGMGKASEDVKSEKDIIADEIKKEQEEEEEKEDEEVDRKLEPSKGFNRERCMPNLSAWIKAFGGPAKSAPGNGSAVSTTATPTAVATVSPLVSPVKRPDPDSKNKFRVMGRGVGEPEGKPHVIPTPNKPIQPIPHHPSVIKTSSSIPSPSSAAVPVVRHHPTISDSIAPTWSPITPLPGPSPTSNPMLNPIKQAALAAAERSSSGAAIEDLSSSPRHHTSKKHRNRKMSSSSLSSQSESGSPICVTSSQDGIGGSGAGGYISGGGSGGVVVNPPRWVDDHPWGPVSQSQSPSASSHVSSQSPAGPNSPFSPNISSPPPSTPQTPPRPTAPVRVGFYQDTTASQHSSPEKVNESQSSPATPPTPNSVHGSSGSGGSSSNANNGSSSRRGTSGNASSSRGESGYPSSATSHYAPRYVASTPSPNISGGPGSNASSGLPSPSTPASNTSGGIAESPGNPNSPHSPKVVNMSNTASSSGSGGAADYRSHSSSGGGVVTTTSSSSSSSTPVANGPQTPAHQQSSRSGASSVLHSTLPYGTPPAHHYSSPSMMEQHLRNAAASHQLPDPAHSHHLHSPSSSAHSHHHQTPAHAHSNAPQTSHAAHAHSIGHLGQPQQAHAGSSSSNQYHSDSGSSRYPPNLPHAHQQSSIANTSSTTSGSSYSSSGSSSSHQNLAQAHAHSRQPTSQPHLSHPYPSNPYTSNPRSINVAPSVYSNPISSDPAMNRYYKATAGATELSLSLGSSGGGSGSSSSSTSAGATNTSSSSSTKRSSRSNASANATPSPHPDIPRSASVNPATAAAMAAAFEGKLGPAELNGFWPHNIASLTQIVNNIPHAYRHYAADPESLSKYQRAAAAAAAAESNSYPVTTSSGGGVNAGVITSGAKSAAMQSSGSSGISSHHHHHSHHSSSEKGSSGNSGSLDHHTHHHHHSDSSSSVPTTSSGKKQSKSSESKSSRSQSNASGKSSSSTSGGGIVPGSAFNFSSLTPDSLALYSKEMSDHAASGGLYSASPPTLTPPLAHRASEFYPTASSASHFSHHSSFSAAARSSAGGVPTPPITPYPFIPGSHPSPYQAHQPVSSQPFAAHSQSSRGLDPYQLFQGSPHVMGLLSHPSGYPAPYAHPHSSLGFNWPGGRI